MKKLFLAIIVIASASVVGQIRKSPGDKPYAASEYGNYQGRDSTLLATTDYTYNANKQIIKEITTDAGNGSIDSTIKNYDANNRIVSVFSFEDDELYNKKIWQYNEPNHQIDYYELVGSSGYLDTAIHILYKGVKNFDEVNDAFSDIFAYVAGTDFELRDCDDISVYYYDSASSSWELMMKITPTYHPNDGVPTDVKVEINVDLFYEMAGDLLEELENQYPYVTITGVTLRLTTNYNGGKLAKINGTLTLASDFITIPVPFVSLINLYEGDLLTETTTEVNVNYMGYGDYLGGSKQKYSYNSDKNLSCVATEYSEDGLSWTSDSKIYYHYAHVGIANADNAPIFVSQNIPNPARDVAMFTYGVPTDGKMVFTVYSVYGQVLYVYTEDAKSGENRLELSVANLSAGFYFYSMEFDGMRVVRKMMIGN